MESWVSLDIYCKICVTAQSKCVAKNVLGTAESICFGSVIPRKFGQPKKFDRLKAPKFHMPLANPRQIPEGAELVLTCVVTGIPEPAVTWYKDGERTQAPRLEAQTVKAVVKLASSLPQQNNYSIAALFITLSCAVRATSYASRYPLVNTCL
ncbi:unnamed protein product [Strongylus vulgaris]|uniref:Ig-like domain-containing protein n=1 Tax=Strongylus vulgaris TaxID=40348 RepID=A0A3P7I5V9_STRVU|nr:unnamed protein product [Strongylus vulgaris]